MASSDSPITTLSAVYKSSTNEPFTHTASLPAIQTTSAKERTAYLGALRSGVTEMQERINKELTARMEEDNLKTKEASDGKGKAVVVDEKKEEDNYGEEVVEED